MYKPVLTALALLGAVSAQKTTELWLIGFAGEDLVGSVVGSDATATTYSIACAGPDADSCAVPPSFTFTQGPSTIHYAYTASEDGVGEETVGVGCVITNSVSGVCSATLSASAGSSSTSSSTTTSFSNAASELGAQIVTITAGAIASAPNSALPTTTTAFSTKGSSSSPTATAAAGSTSSSVSNAGVPMISGDAPWVIGVAAAALAFAAM